MANQPALPNVVLCPPNDLLSLGAGKSSNTIFFNLCSKHYLKVTIKIYKKNYAELKLEWIKSGKYLELEVFFSEPI